MYCSHGIETAHTTASYMHTGRILEGTSMLNLNFS